ncbi:Helicase required for RNAi-mediated heterochromatin assembly 1 [Trichoderma ghanense]|uniref:Helicase required for RNAi-mediated heterochromatin assembly 1 n=1 Tax=Trichoderma ghanense TaxID=65468 RepID=A0ABY2GTM9_9HYPO
MPHGEQDLIVFDTLGDDQGVVGLAPTGPVELQALSLLDDQPSGRAWQAYVPLEPVHEGEDLLQFDSEAPQDDNPLPQPSLNKGKGKEPLYPVPANGDRPDAGPSSPINPEDEGPLIEQPVHEPLSYVPAPASDFFRLETLAKLSLHVRNGQLDQQFSDDFREAWRSAPEIVLSSALMADDTPLPPKNRLDIFPDSKVEYLRVHYELCRYEATEPLREAVAEFREDRKMMEGERSKAYIYTKVRVTGILLSKQGACSRITFSTERVATPIDWRHSDRLTPGTLVALSPSWDNFRSKCIVATIATRSFNGRAVPDVEDGDNPFELPRVELFFANTSETLIDPVETFVMLEAKVSYFENVRHTMLSLQHAAMYQTPLDRFILDPAASGTLSAAATGSSTICVDDEECRQASAINPAGDTVVVPQAAEHFDQSQKQAFDIMSTQALSIVQGPPGTGKTFTSVVAIRGFVETQKAAAPGSRRAPIIISAQTNHALDQILDLCLDHNVGKILRLGGQSRSEFVSRHSLFNIRSKSRFRRQDYRGLASWKRICASIEELVETYTRDLVGAQELLDANIISAQQYQSLVEGSPAAAQIAQDEHTEDPNKISLVIGWLYSFSNQDPEEGIRAMLPGKSRKPIVGRVDDTPDDDMEEEGQAVRGKAPDDAAFQLRGLYLPFDPQHTVAPAPPGCRRTGRWWQEARALVKGSPDLNKISAKARPMVYYYLKTRLRDCTAKAIRERLQVYKEVCETLKVHQLANTLHVIDCEGIDIIGCTTTGLSKYRGLLAALLPRVMLIEEAAEAREGSIAAALFPSLEQLALVGDHQQLAPQVDIQFLGAAPYNLKVSMFERLVKLGFPYKTLQVQRRMIPRIREVVQTFYPMLRDHPMVKDIRKRPPVPGMGGTNLWWFQHQWPETWGKKLSYSNYAEAEMVVGFLHHLMMQDVEPNQVTVLTYYSAQVELIKELIHHDHMLRFLHPVWSVRTVDGFQGEENDIIILSLVRSPSDPMGGNSRTTVGFVEDENRAVVAMSRARRGLYVFGNARHILGSSQKSYETWQKVFNAFGTQTGDHVPLTCRTHGNLTAVETADDWKRILPGGCLKPCNQECPKGHKCSYQCHTNDIRHRTCREPCPRILFCGHLCGKRCSELCRCPRGCRPPAPVLPFAATRQPAMTPPVLPPLSPEESPLDTPLLRQMRQWEGMGGAADEDGEATLMALRRRVANATSDEMMAFGYRNFLRHEERLVERARAQARRAEGSGESGDLI